MRRISTGWRLAKDSWAVLVADRSLAVFPVLSFVSAAVALTIFLAPGLAMGSPDEVTWPLAVGALVGSYLATFCTIYFNVALAGAARRSMAGEDTSLRDGLEVARERRGVIARWALVQWAVGLVLHLLAPDDDDSVTGRIVGWAITRLLGAAWVLATFFVVPVLAFEGRTPGDAFKRSFALVRERWGEGIAGNVGIGLAVTVIGGLPVLALFGFAFLMADTSTVLFVTFLGLAVLGAVGVSAVASALNVIFCVALYRYASYGTTTDGFATNDLTAAFVPKARKRR